MKKKKMIKRKIKKFNTKSFIKFIYLFPVYCLLFTAYCNLYAFEPGFPNLLWENEYPFEIDGITLADDTGDVLLCDKESAQLILIDSQKNEKLHLGPKFDTSIMEGINISSDGNKIMYCAALPKLKLELNLITQNGKKILKKNVNDIQYLSPKGDWYVLAYWGNCFEPKPVIKAYAISGKSLWENNAQYVTSFSLDNNYFLAGTNINGWWSEIEDKDIIINTYNRQGKLKWEEKFKSNRFGYIGEAEIVKGGYIVWNYKAYHKIYDYLGNIVTEIPGGVKKAFISPDGKAVMFQYDNSFQILNLPDKNIKLERKMNFFEAKLSNEGKYLVGLRKPTQDMPENIIIIDIQNNLLWKTKIGESNEEYVDRSLQNNDTNTYLTNNGKYLFIIKQGRKHLYYYQLY